MVNPSTFVLSVAARAEGGDVFPLHRQARASFRLARWSGPTIVSESLGA